MPVEYLTRPGPSGAACMATGFSNAAILPAGARIVITAGQAGIDLGTGDLVTSSAEAQISAAFDCLEVALKTAGVTAGLAGAYKVTSYLTDPQKDDALMMRLWRERVPAGHRPVWASVGSHALVLPGMIIELQAEAVLPEGGRGRL
jgi:enamine deaminase RidA (YjgF/YER057c/UK114 family)